jgi:hypothetical protein
LKIKKEFKMNDKKINKQKDKSSELITSKVLPNRELQNEIYDSRNKNFKNKEKADNKFYYWDLSGGLLGI